MINKITKSLLVLAVGGLMLVGAAAARSAHRGRRQRPAWAGGMADRDGERAGLGGGRAPVTGPFRDRRLEPPGRGGVSCNKRTSGGTNGACRRGSPRKSASNR